MERALEMELRNRGDDIETNFGRKKYASNNRNDEK